MPSNCLVSAALSRELVVLAVLVTCGLCTCTAAPAGKDDSPKPLPREVVAAWKKAGAEVGWMGFDEFGNLKFRPLAKGASGDPPAFKFSAWKEGVLETLTAPVAFGLDLSSSELPDAALTELAALKTLQTLDLRRTKVTDVGLRDLPALKSLRTLNLSEAKVTDGGLKELGALKTLQWLDLDHTQVTDDGLRQLAELKNLQTLRLVHTGVTGPGLKDLVGLNTLQSLDLFDCSVTDAGLKELAELKSLQTLSLAATEVTDAGPKERYFSAHCWQWKQTPPCTGILLRLPCWASV